MDHASTRRNMVENQLRPNRIEDQRLLEAMLEVPRERFVPKTFRGVAYADEDLILPSGQHLVEPLVLARMIQSAAIGPDDVALVLGCGTGYTAAIVGRLAATVITLAPDEVSAGQIESLLDDLGSDNVVVTQNQDPLAGAPDQAPFNVILLAGAVPEVPASLQAQLGEHGRLVAVLDHGPMGKGTLFTRLHGVIGRRTLFDANIPPMPGLTRPVEFAF